MLGEAISFKMEHLIPLYRHRLHLSNATFSRIEHEDAMVAIVYEVQQTNRKLILKICSNSSDYFREVYFLQHFKDTLPVPLILDVVPPEEDVNGAILMDCLPGTLLKLNDCSDRLAFEVGAKLACIHLNRLSGYGDPIQAQKLNQDPRVYYTFKFEEGLEECKNQLSKKLLEQSKNFYDEHVNLLLTVDGPCIVHRDFRPGNILVHNGKLQGIIDWAGARASFAEEDFCPLEGEEWGFSSIIKKSFLAGYASIRRVPDYGDLMPLLLLSRAFATIGFTIKKNTWDNIHERLYKRNLHFLETFKLEKLK